MTKFRKSYLLKHFLFPVIIYISGVVLYIFWSGYTDNQRITKSVDQRLLQAAGYVRFILPDDFHDRAVGKEAVSDSEHTANIYNLNEFAHAVGLTYLYTAVVQSNEVFFTSSSASEEEIAAKKLPEYWEVYPEATKEFKGTVDHGTPVFETSSDRWGHFRSAIICVTSPGGKKYLVGADMDVSFIRGEVIKMIPYTLIRALFFLLIGIPIFFAIRKFYLKSTRKLQDEIKERWQAERELEEYKANLEEIVKSRTTQLEREIGDRKSIEEELHKAKELAVRESRAKSIFLANMSHEIRTPMNGVIGMANILKDTELTEEQKEYLEIIEVSGNNLLTIINDILDFSKIEAGQVELESIPFSLPQQVEEVTKLLHLKAESKGLKLFFSLSPQLPEKIKGDPVRFKQIVLNLTNNAIKFTEDGSITIAMEAVWQKEDKLMIRCNVKDTGIGISEQGKAKLFQEFSQTDASTTRKYGGTGLGLKISKDLVKLMGGEIGVESDEGKGSTFWFTAVFDKVVQSEADKLDRENKKNLTKSYALLLVEDNYISQKVAKTSLEKDGYNNLDIAENGKVAVRLCGEKEYHIILMDIRMPLMDGIEATEKIRELEKLHPERQPAYIVAFTAYAVEGDRERFLEAGMDDYIAKPFQPEELIRVIEKYAARYRFRSQRSMKILLAEDNKINQKVAQKTLEAFGHKVVLVENGLEAVERFRDHDFDLILMDLEMPEMDGLEATRSIRKMEKERFLQGDHRKKVKIVALTAHSTTDDKERCLAAGMDDYISKPFRQAELARALSL